MDTFLTTLYVMVDDFGKASWPPEPRPGPQAALSRSEVVTLAMFGQWQGFGSERGFYRYVQRHLRAARWGRISTPGRPGSGCTRPRRRLQRARGPRTPRARSLSVPSS